MTSKQAEEAARQEAIRRGYGPRIADWFVRGAYAAATGAEHAPQPAADPRLVSRRRALV